MYVCMSTCAAKNTNLSLVEHGYCNTAASSSNRLVHDYDSELFDNNNNNNNYYTHSTRVTGKYEEQR